MTVGKGKRHVNFNLVFRLVLAVSALSLGLPELHGGQPFLANRLVYIISDTVIVYNLLLDEFRPLLFAEDKEQTVVYNRLTFYYI